MKILFAFISACHLSRRSHVESLLHQMFDWMKWGVNFDWRIVFGDIETQKESDRWEPTIVPSHHILTFPGVDDTRRWMTLKDQALFRYALENDYTHVFRACDDSVVFPHRLLHHEVAFAHDYFGTMCGYGRIAGVKGSFVIRYLDYMHGGVGVGLSSKAMLRLVNDLYPGPEKSPYKNIVDILPNHQLQGGWGTYWDDLWMGEVLKGHIAYSSDARNNTYYNYQDNGIEVYDNPTLFASNFPFDTKKVIAHHSIEQMGHTNLTPGPFSTRFSKSAKLSIPFEMIDPKFNLHEPDPKHK